MLQYVIVDDIKGVTGSLEKASNTLFEWFENNLLKSNAGKCHLLVNMTYKLINVRNCRCQV